MSFEESNQLQASGKGFEAQVLLLDLKLGRLIRTDREGNFVIFIHPPDLEALASIPPHSVPTALDPRCLNPRCACLLQALSLWHVLGEAGIIFVICFFQLMLSSLCS
jgi:hypothetical protein